MLFPSVSSLLKSKGHQNDMPHGDSSSGDNVMNAKNTIPNITFAGCTMCIMVSVLQCISILAVEALSSNLYSLICSNSLVFKSIYSAVLPTHSPSNDNTGYLLHHNYIVTQ